MYQYLGKWRGTFSIDPDALIIERDTDTNTGANDYARPDKDRKWGISIDADNATNTNATNTDADRNHLREFSVVSIHEPDDGNDRVRHRTGWKSGDGIRRRPS